MKKPTSFSIDPEVLEQFKAIVKNLPVTASAQVEELIKKFIAENTNG